MRRSVFDYQSRIQRHGGKNKQRLNKSLYLCFVIAPFVKDSVDLRKLVSYANLPL